MKRRYKEVEIILNPLTPEAVRIAELEKIVREVGEYPYTKINHTAINLKLRLDLHRLNELYSKLQENYLALAKQHRDMRELFDDAFVIKSRKKV